MPLPPMPPRIAHRPRDHRGYPIPWFVSTVGGVPDFRVADQGKWFLAIKFKRCWVCGEALGRHQGFLIGPMCAVNRITSEPPCHRECAVWSAMACPFLTKPRMRRNEKDMPEGFIEPAGFGLLRNPGCAVVWMTREFSTFRVPHGAEGHLIELGPPTEVLWFIEGRMAMRDEALAAMERGIPALREMCAKEATPQLREKAFKQLEEQYAAAQALVPGGAHTREAG